MNQVGKLQKTCYPLDFKTIFYDCLDFRPLTFELCNLWVQKQIEA
jgi:hypothetical protein